MAIRSPTRSPFAQQPVMPSQSQSQDLEYAALSVAGQVRSSNEDAVLCRPDLGLWAVADGMGGHRRGELASATALAALEREVAAGTGLVAAVHLANQAILAEVEADAAVEGMGTTLVAVHFRGEGCQLAWVGDSRAYRIGQAGIEQLSRDHSWVQSMVDAGELSAEEARQHPRRNVILQCLGRDDQALEVDCIELQLAPGELLLLCSDGLTGELEDEQIRELCTRAGTLVELVESLVELANRHGGRDNISCVVLGRSQRCEAAVAQPRGGLLRRLFGKRAIPSRNA